jgi:hypothetical protein
MEMNFISKGKVNDQRESRKREEGRKKEGRISQELCMQIHRQKEGSEIQEKD